MFKKKTVVGVVYDPLSKELFLAVKGYGAYLNGIQISVSDATSIKDAMLVSLPKLVSVDCPPFSVILPIIPSI